MKGLIQTHKYDDIIHLARPVSVRHARMDRADRAIQFSPFAALTGYEDVIEETARLTDADTDLTDSSITFLNEQLQILESRIAEQPAVSLMCFRPDDRKEGGSYIRISGQVKKLDPYAGVLILTDQQQIPFETLKMIEILD